MFTGLIEAVCVVRSVSANAGGLSLTIDLGEVAKGCKSGDSIAINGACLTVAELRGSLAAFEVSRETLEKSALGRLKPSSKVNVERAMKLTDRFGGHFVQGHIDGTATIKAIKRQGQFADIEFSAKLELLRQMVVKGSVAVDGISLTVAGMDEHSFRVAIIPQTLKETTLGTAKVGDEVNIETDIIVKTVRSELHRLLPPAKELTVERLREMGF